MKRRILISQKSADLAIEANRDKFTFSNRNCSLYTFGRIDSKTTLEICASYKDENGCYIIFSKSTLFYVKINPDLVFDKILVAIEVPLGNQAACLFLDNNNGLTSDIKDECLAFPTFQIWRMDSKDYKHGNCGERSTVKTNFMREVVHNLTITCLNNDNVVFTITLPCKWAGKNCQSSKKKPNAPFNCEFHAV